MRLTTALTGIYNFKMSKISTREKVLLKLNQYNLTRLPLRLLHVLLQMFTVAALKRIPNITSIYSMREFSSQKVYGITDLDLALVIDTTKESDSFRNFKKYSQILKIIKFMFKLLDRNGTIIIEKDDFHLMEEFNLGFYWSEHFFMKDWTRLWGQELRTGKAPQRSKIGPDTVWRIQSLFQNTALSGGRKITKQIEKTNEFLGTRIQPNPYGLYQALEKWAGGTERPILNTLHSLNHHPLRITDDQYFVVPSNLSEEDFLTSYQSWQDLSAQTSTRIFFMGNKFFMTFLQNFSHYVAFEPFILCSQLSLKPDIDLKLWRSLIQDVMVEKNERLLRDLNNDRYESTSFYDSKYKKLMTYLHLLTYQDLPDKVPETQQCKRPQERFSVIYNIIDQCITLIKSKKHETL